MKSSEFITEAVNKRSYNKQIIDVLKSHGFKVDSREQSAGALKTWLNAPSPVTLQDIVAELAPKFPGTKLEDWDGDMDTEIRGPGYQIEKQGQRSIFLAVYAGPKAEEFAMGLDEDTVDDDMRNSVRRQARLKAEVEAGMMPTVHNVTSTTEPVYTMGDLRDIGWMETEYITDREGDVEGWIRHYDGPAPIKVHTRGARELRVLKPGEILD